MIFIFFINGPPLSLKDEMRSSRGRNKLPVSA